MKFHRTIAAFSGLAVLIASSIARGNQKAYRETESYAVKVEFAQGYKLKFPDFTLLHTGQHRTKSPKYPRGFLFYDFKVEAKRIEKNVSWSSGTGDIGPVEFEIDGKHYLLELKRSDKLGPLQEYELVVSKKQ